MSKTKPMHALAALRARERSSTVQSGGLMPLVDILFATLGVFVIVLATQEIFEDVPKVQVPVDAVVVCSTPQDLRLFLQGAPEPRDVALDTLQDDILQHLPEGGIVTVGIEDGCLTGKGSAFYQLTLLDDALALNADQNVFFRMNFVPLSNEGPFSASSLILALAGEGAWPPSTEGARP